MKPIYHWALRIIPAFILLQTLFFKFTGSAESVYIFETMRIEPWGRYSSGLAELIAAILLLIPKTSPFGALIASGVMMGSILSHLTMLGIEVMGDGGLLFGMAWVVLICSLIIIVVDRKQLLESALLKKINGHS